MYKKRSDGGLLLPHSNECKSPPLLTVTKSARRPFEAKVAHHYIVFRPQNSNVGVLDPALPIVAVYSEYSKSLSETEEEED
jgi:hypothetical protein